MTTTQGEVLLEATDLVTRFPVRRGLLDALRRTPRREVHAVDGVTLRVRAGELVAFVGESGSGKTTTAQTMLQLVRPTSGTVTYRGRDLAGLDAAGLRDLRRRVQVVFQDPYESLDPRFTVVRTVAEPLVVHGIGVDDADRRARVVEALERAGLRPAERFLDRFPHELSGGQRQRVAIAAALVTEPELLVLDEPVSMLDVSVRAGVLALLDELRSGGIGIVMITHDLSTAARYADRIAVMYLGRVVEEGPAAEVVGAPVHPYTRALIAAVPGTEQGMEDASLPEGEVPDATDVPAGCRFHPRCPRAEAACRTDDPRLLPVPGRQGSAACPVVAREPAVVR